MKTSLWLAALTGLVALPSCTTIERGTVTKNLGDDEARVALGSNDDLEPGSRVDLFNKNCYPTQPSTVATDMDVEDCKDVRVGGATVTEIEGPHQSVVKLDQGTRYAFGTIVKPAETQPAH